ncbi:MAG: hypothetical protein ABJ327_11130 [Litoreibacter sp.]
MHSKLNKARSAARNNADLCAAIMAANEIRTERDEIAYFCIDDPPPYYPKMVTLDPEATRELNVRAKGASVIKDSFSCLDVDSLGVNVAFDASWIWCEIKQHALPANWVRIETAHDLMAWHQAWCGDDSSMDQLVFTPRCLENNSLAFLARLSGTRIEAGCIANLSEDVIGISNVFSTVLNDQSYYEEALSVVSMVGNGRPVVGYERGTSLQAATSAGFQVVGPLRVLM